MKSDRSSLISKRNILPPSSELKGKPCKLPARSRWQAELSWDGCNAFLCNQTGQSSNFLTSTSMMGVQRNVQAGLTDRMSYKKYVVLVHCARPLLISNILCGLLQMHFGLIFIFRADNMSDCICAP
jgi:hypothetical protein